jgi:hypothetical protein
MGTHLFLVNHSTLEIRLKNKSVPIHSKNKSVPIHCPHSLIPVLVAAAALVLAMLLMRYSVGFRSPLK